MRLNIVLVILRKELTETLRDRRTLMMMIGLPVLLYPLMLIGISKVQESQSEARAARMSRVAVWGDAPGEMLARLGNYAANEITVMPADTAPREIREGLANGTLARPAGEATA